MKRYAVVPVSGGVVSNVVVGDDLASVSAVVGECVEETSATGVAGIGDAWNGTVFVPFPFLSWRWNGSEWVAPVPMPADEHTYVWDEDTRSWVVTE